MKEEVIIDLKLERDDGDFAKLANLKQSLVNIKHEQAQLNQAYKNGAITIKEFASETVRLEANQKRLAAAYSETQRKVTGLKNPFDKVTDAIKDQANQVQVAGVSLATFANPVTATVGVLGALFKAYASSTIGAKDLEFASNQLGASFNYAANQFAGLISSAEDGEGIFAKLSFAISGAVFGLDNAISGRVFAGFQEKLDDLAREEVKIRTENTQRLEDNAEIMAKLQDSNVDILEKQHLSSEAIRNLRQNETDLLAVKEEQLKTLETLLALDKANEKLQDAVGLKEQEIAVIKRDTERKVQNIVKLESNLLDAETKKTEQLQKQDELRQKKIQDEQAAEKKKLDDKGLADEMKRLEDLQKLREENSAAAFKEEWDMKVAIATEANAEMDRQAQANFDKEKRRNDQKMDRVRSITKDLTMTLTTALTDSAQIGEQILKSFLIMAIRSLKQFLLVKVVGESFATPDSIFSFGASGAIRAAVMAGLIEGVFAGVESAIAGFADGGVVSGTRIGNQGRKIRRSNGDDRLVTVKTGEVVLNERQQRMLGGDNTFRKLGIPGFATGGMIPNNIQLPQFDSTMIMKMASQINKRQVAVVIEDVERLMASRANILEKATL